MFRFGDILGQENVTGFLKQVIRNRQMPKVLILFGPSGVGKTTLAWTISAAVNCLNPVDIEPCGRCSSCLSISERKHIDIVEIDAALNSGVEEIREIIENSLYRPKILDKKVFIIDECQRLSPAAFSAILKTLEDTIESNYFIMVTTNIEKIPDSIVSRGVRLSLRRLRKIELESILDIRSRDLSDEVRKAIIFASQGNARNLINLIPLAEYVKDRNKFLVLAGIPRPEWLSLYWRSIRFNNLRLTYIVVEWLNSVSANQWINLNHLLFFLTERRGEIFKSLFKRSNEILIHLLSWNWVNEDLILHVFTSLLVRNSFSLINDILLNIASFDTRLYWSLMKNRDRLIIEEGRLRVRGSDKFNKKIDLCLESIQVD